MKIDVTNISKKIGAALTGMLLLVGALSAPLTADENALPDLGDESLAVIGPAQERKLGEDFMLQARRSLKFMDDPELNAYIQALGQRLAVHADYPSQQFSFYLIDDPSINAFAVPGGFISLNTGLIQAAESEAELAAVVAHEIAHISQRHIPRMIVAQKRSAGVSLAALLAAIVLLSAGETQGGEAAIALSTAASIQQQLNFTRTHEQEADRIGTQILAKAGYDPRAMSAFFERLQNWSRLHETNLPEFLRTHPITSSRIAESQDRASRYPTQDKTANKDFLRVRAKIKAITATEPATMVAMFKASLGSAGDQQVAAERYGYAHALLAARQYDQARQEIGILLKGEPDAVAYRITQAEIEMAAERYPEALKLYAAAYRQSPHDLALLRGYGGSLLKTGDTKQAQAILDGAVRRHPQDATLHKMLATAAGENGDRVGAHSALAEHYYLTGDLHAAIKQLDIAARFTGNSHYQQARLDARKQEIKSYIDRAAGR